MSIVTLETAKEHLRVVSMDEDARIQGYLDAAELAAVGFLNRYLYANEAALLAAKSSVNLASATASYEAAMDTAAGFTNGVERNFWEDMAQRDYAEAQRNAVRTYRGLVINAQVTSAILLTLGHLFENRESEIVGGSFSQAATGATELLMPFRIEMGV